MLTSFLLLFFIYFFYQSASAFNVFASKIELPLIFSSRPHRAAESQMTVNELPPQQLALLERLLIPCTPTHSLSLPYSLSVSLSTFFSPCFPAVSTVKVGR